MIYDDVIVFEYGLDGDYYERQSWWDSPGFEALWHTWRLYRLVVFHTVLMFKSDKPDSIFVPIKRLRWTWSGDAELSLFDNWNLNNSMKDVRIQNTLDFPVWNEILTNN